MDCVLLRMAAAGFTAWLRDKFPPPGRPCLHDLSADLTKIIDTVAASPNGGSLPAPSLSECALRDAIDWLLASYAAAHSGKDELAVAQVAAHALRYIAHSHTNQILASMLSAPSTSTR